MIELITFIFGLAVGSFLNVVIFRMESEKEFWGLRSACRHCNKDIAWHDNIPIISFVILRARCRFCQKKISWQYPLVELLTGIIFVWFYFLLGLNLQFFASIILSSFLIIIFVYDLRHFLILDVVTLPAMALALIFNLVLQVSWWSLFLGATIGALFFGLQFIVSKGKWVGDGDIRLGALMGLILGWKLLLVALFLAYLVGALVGIALMASRKKEMSSQIPFGPFLAGATIITMMYGESLLSWYLSFIYY